MLGIETGQGQRFNCWSIYSIAFLELSRFFVKLQSFNRLSHLCRKSNPRPHTLVEVQAETTVCPKCISNAGVRNFSKSPECDTHTRDLTALWCKDRRLSFEPYTQNNVRLKMRSLDFTFNQFNFFRLCEIFLSVHWFELCNFTKNRLSSRNAIE